ncbi:MAG: CHAD domain-containing protein [Candidatus Competibacteraceae bacterium]
MSAALIHVKTKPLHLSADATVEDAFSDMVGVCLCHAEANRPAVLENQIEGVHQMRVAFRRLRSGLKIFRPRIPRAASAGLVEEIRWLNGWLGPARDWDVFLEEGLVPVFSRFPRKRGLLLFRGKAERLRHNHYQALQAALTEPRYPLLLQRFADWLDRRAWRQDLSDAEQESLAEPALAFATPLLERDQRRVLKQGEAFAELSDGKRHKLRIRIKELRYALDFFASLYPAPAVKAYLGALSMLQDSLGVMNDITVARRLLDETQLTTASATRQVIEGWYGCRLETHERQFAEVWRRFTDCVRPWRN